MFFLISIGLTNIETIHSPIKFGRSLTKSLGYEMARGKETQKGDIQNMERVLQCCITQNIGTCEKVGTKMSFKEEKKRKEKPTNLTS